jgi:anaerobic selenocysteine-containing dehydrogenase
MRRKEDTTRVRGYCAQCTATCPTIADVRNGVFEAVHPDWDHPNGCQLCLKGLAGPELVYSPHRLQYPIRRTRPKGDADPGWKRITWDEALDTIAARLNEVRMKWGPEALAIARGGPSGCAVWDFNHWVSRLGYAYGTPNFIATVHICQWHRDNCSAYTYGKPGTQHTAGRAEFEHANCMLIWGNNPHHTDNSKLRDIKAGLANGAKLIVIDPRKTELAKMADLHLAIAPGTDGALALAMTHVLLEEGLYDKRFTLDWTTAPFLVREDTGYLLRADEVSQGADAGDYTVTDAAGIGIQCHRPGLALQNEPALDARIDVTLTNGEPVTCKTVFRLLRERAADYSPDRIKGIVGVPASKIRDAVRMFTRNRPGCWYSWNGIEQNTNASQTNRAICIFYALTGDYDQCGGNVRLPTPALNLIAGSEFLTRAARENCLGYHERPLGPVGTTVQTQAYEVYNAILTGRPYPIKALMGFGGNLITSNAPSRTAKAAIAKLDFHFQTELFLTPTAELADIVLPAASFWESWHVKADFKSLKARTHIQFRPAVVPPLHECWPDMKIIFELAKRLGLGDKFWNGDVESAFNYQLERSRVTVAELRKYPGGLSLDLPREYENYRKKDPDGRYQGFATPSRRVELYSDVFKAHGQDPLPVWKPHIISRWKGTELGRRYPLTLINDKPAHYCHSQQRSLPSIRKALPHPCVEIHPKNAGENDCRDGELIILETPHGCITLKAKVTDSVPYNVVCAQHGWWQGCPELDLPGYDPYSSQGANANLIYDTGEIDPISGSLPIKGYPCTIRKRKFEEEGDPNG